MKNLMIILVCFISKSAHAQVYLAAFEYPCYYNTEVCTFSRTDGMEGKVKYSKTACVDLKFVFNSEHSVSITDMNKSKYTLKEVIDLKTTDDFEMKSYAAIDNDNESCTFSEIYNIKKQQLEYMITYQDHTFLYTR